MPGSYGLSMLCGLSTLQNDFQSGCASFCFILCYLFSFPYLTSDTAPMGLNCFTTYLSLIRMVVLSSQPLIEPESKFGHFPSLSFPGVFQVNLCIFQPRFSLPPPIRINLQFLPQPLFLHMLCILPGNQGGGKKEIRSLAESYTHLFLKTCLFERCKEQNHFQVFLLHPGVQISKKLELSVGQEPEPKFPNMEGRCPQ